MSRVAKPKPLKGQLVRLTQRDYRLLLEGLQMAQEWRAEKVGDEIAEFDEQMEERWAVLWKIRDAVYPKKPKPDSTERRSSP